MIEVELDQKQLDKILKNIEPEQLKGPVKELISDAGEIGYEESKELIKGGTDQAGYSLRYDVEPMTAKVYSVMPFHRAMSIEEGRDPGEEAPFMQIARWHTGRRYMTSRRQMDREDIEATREIQDAIRMGGAEGKGFLKGAAEKLQKELPDLISTLAKKIESRFGK